MATLVSLLLGRLLASPDLPGQIGLPLRTVLGAIWAILAGGRLEKPILNWLSKLPPLILQVLRYWRWHEIAPDWQPLITAGQLLSADTAEVWQRLAAWLTGIWQHKPALDSMPLAIFWILVMWLCAFWAGWATRRTRNPLLSLTPAVGLLAAVLNYQGSDARTLVAPLAAVMLLMALLHYDNREHRWLKQHVDFAEDISIDFGGYCKCG